MPTFEKPFIFSQTIPEALFPYNLLFYITTYFLCEFFVSFSLSSFSSIDTFFSDANPSSNLAKTRARAGVRVAWLHFCWPWSEKDCCGMHRENEVFWLWILINDFDNFDGVDECYSIPANFLWDISLRFLSWECWDFWRQHDHFRRFPKKSEVFQRRPKFSEDVLSLPKAKLSKLSQSQY